METLDIFETVRKMVADGDAKGAQDFLIAHFKELPEEIQGDLLVEFIKDAGKENEFQNLAEDVKEEAVDLIEMIDAAEKDLKAIIAGT